MTSGECIPESSWCDGVQDCPDDEKNCFTSERPSISFNRTEKLGRKIIAEIFFGLNKIFIHSDNEEMSRSKLSSRLCRKAKKGEETKNVITFFRQLGR